MPGLTLPKTYLPKRTLVSGKMIFLKIIVFLNWTICAVHPKGLIMASIQTDIFQSTTLLSQDFPVVLQDGDTGLTHPDRGEIDRCVHLLECVCVCERWKTDTEREEERERESSQENTLNSHRRNNSWKCSCTHNNLCSCQPMSLKNTFPCILPTKAKNVKVHTK